MNARTIYFFCLCLFLLSCKSKKFAMDSYNNEDMVIPAEFKSYLAINYKLDRQGIQDTFNIIIDQFLTDDLEIDAYGMDIKISKHEDATLDFEGRKIRINMPVDIALEKSTIFQDVKANGVLDLTFESNMDIDSSWNLITKSNLAHYEWLKKPKLEMGALTLPIEGIANSVIEKSKDEIARNIDLSINEQFGLREKILEVMKYVEEPYLLDSRFNVWMLLSPDSILISELENKSNWTTGRLGVYSETKMSSEKPVRIAGLQLPEFDWNNTVDPVSKINLQLEADKIQVEELINKNFVGKTFENDGKEITIHKAKLFGVKDEIAVETETSGSFNGTLVIKGKPKYNDDKKEIYVDDLDISVKTNNFLHRAGSWLFKSKIKNSLSEMLTISVAENVDLAQEKIDEYVAEINKKGKAEFSIDIMDSSIKHLIIKEDKIYIGLNVLARLDAQIYDFMQLKELGNFPKLKG